MRLNNKGFAVSIILYSIIIVVILILSMILSVYATNIHNKIALSDTVKNNIIDKEVVDIDFLNLDVKLNKNIPSTITRGDNYLILDSYSGGDVVCSIDNSNVSNPTIANTNNLTVGTHTISCTVTNSDSLSKTDTKEITVTYEAYTITNLITNGSFESNSNNWSLSNAEVVSGGSNGSKSLRFKNGNLTAIVTQEINYTPVRHNKYYGFLMFKSSSNYTNSNGGYEMFYENEFDGKMIFSRNNISTNDWARISYIQYVSTGTYLENPWIVRSYVKNGNNYSYIDSLVLVDLTSTFGSGNEPDRNWCDTHINFFNGTTTIYK